MLATLFNWLVVSWFCFLVGTRIEDSLWKVRPAVAGLWQIPLTLLHGLAGCTLLASITSLFWPLNWETLIKFSAVAMLESLLHLGFYVKAFKNRLIKLDKGFWQLGIFAVLAFGVFYLKSFSPSEIFDEGAYYRPFIVAAEKFGIVPGLGNLNLHSALNSSWHVVQALFGMKGFWFPPGVYDLNGLLCVWLLGMAVFAGHTALRSKNLGVKTLPLLLLFALPAFVYRNLLTGPSSDIPAIAISWLVWILFLFRALEKDKDAANYFNFSLIWLGLFVFTIKLTSIMLLLPGLFLVLWWMVNRQRKLAGIWMVVGLLVLFPHLYRNYILSGYLFYPLTQFDWFSPDWKVPLDRIQNKFYMAQFGAFAPPENYSLSWLKSWFSAFNVESRVIIGLAFMQLLAGPFLLWYYRNQFGLFFRALYVSMLAASLVWLFSVTEPRYGFGTLLILALGLIVLIIIRFNDRWVLGGYFGLIIGLQSTHFVKTVREFEFEKIRWWKGSAIPPVINEKMECGNFTVNTPVSYKSNVPGDKPVFCWDIKFPCLPKEDVQDAYRIVKRTNKLADGFKSLPAKP